VVGLEGHDGVMRRPIERATGGDTQHDSIALESETDRKDRR
jgi:hypothetical protein